MLDLFADAEVMRFGAVRNANWVRRWMAERLREYHESQQLATWAVVKKKGFSVLGYCGLTHFPDVAGQPEIEIGYRLARSHWGYGYATEAASAIRDFAFGSLGIERLIALIDPANTASVRVAEKLGMHHEADAMLEGYSHPDRVYVVEHDT